VKRERLTQIVLVIVGLLDLSLIYFLYMDLRHSSWLLEQKNECDPMFLSFFIPVGVFLLMAARRPPEHRSMIALAAWWNISHGVVGDGYSNRRSPDSRRPQGLYRRGLLHCDRRRLVSASASKTRGSRVGCCVNERRNPHAARINRFFSFSLHGFFPRGRPCSAAALGQIGVKSLYHKQPAKLVITPVATVN
jgi:hypothetical protein